MSTQQDINAIRAQRFANTHDPLALITNTQTPFHPDHSPLITYIQHPQPNNNFVQQPSFNTNYMQQPMQNPKDILVPTTALDMELELMHMLMVDDNVGNQFRENVNGLSVVPEIANQHRNGNVVAAWAEGNANGNNGNQIRCYNCQGEDHLACNCTIERVNANCTLDDNLQEASTSGTQTDKAPVYDSDESAEVHHSENCYDNDTFNIVGGIVEQHPATPKETRALYDSLYNNLATEVEKVNSVNHKLRETNADLTTELARYKNQEKVFEISQEKYDKLKRCYQKSVYQEQCLTKKINALHLSSDKQITTLNEEISNQNKQLSMEKSSVSSLLEEKKRLKFDFKIREDELLDKQIQHENNIKELDNILV
ncbi:hypothetical protein Tco_0344585 [Tanacetum coccineum]